MENTQKSDTFLLKFCFPDGLGLREVKSVRESVRVECDRLGMEAKDSFVLFFIVDELCCNVMEHSKAAWMELKVDVHKDRFHVIIRDNGVPFDTGFKLEMAKGGEVRTDGDRRLGLALVSRLVDMITYERLQEGINQLDLEKKL
jgi:anti-sigma regulatory factor (Ser/Thr protein kinase)